MIAGKPPVLLLLVSALFLLAFFPDSEPHYPRDYFHSPIKGPLLLAGTFGELRPNHFHSGIDIKGGMGVPVYAAADGYVSRIKVDASGYGNFLQITHPNGYSTCYAHLNAFIPEIREFVLSHQRADEKFEVELFPRADQFPVYQGDLIAEMGNTGGSQGPHLHFEIRETESEIPLNPLLFGLDVTDNQPPRMHQLKMYWLNDRREDLGENLFSLIRKGSGYGIKGDTLLAPSDRVGFALKVYDHMNYVSNWNGIYSLDVFKGDSLIYNFTLDKFSFDETRYLNAHLDYDAYREDRAYFNRCYALPGNHLSIYRHEKNNGVVTLSRTKAVKMKMVAKDADGNASVLEFWVRQKGDPPVRPEKTYNYFLPYDEASIVDNPSVYLYFPDSTLYQDLYMEYNFSTDHSDNIYSSVHHIHDAAVPVNRYFDIAIRATSMPENLRDKAFIAYCGAGNYVLNCGGKWNEKGFLESTARSLGDYCIMTDLTPPTIRPVNFKYDMRRSGSMSFRIDDNYPTAGNVPGLDFHATIDGQWVLMEYDAKRDRITHTFSGNLPSGKHNLRLVVRDAVGNERVLEEDFLR